MFHICHARLIRHLAYVNTAMRVIEDVIRGRDYRDLSEFIEAVVERLKAIRRLDNVEVVIRRLHN